MDQNEEEATVKRKRSTKAKPKKSRRVKRSSSPEIIDVDAISIEQRAAPYRSTCPYSLRERMDRAMSQRLYLVQQSEIPPDDAVVATSAVEFTVLGSTGNVYTVDLCLKPTCSCPDFGRRQDMCKHIMFVLLKVFGLGVDNPLAYQEAYITSELKELFSILRSRRVGGTVLANAQVRAAVGATGTITSETHVDGTTADETESKVERRSLEENADCPICFDDMASDGLDKLTYCRGTCGANFHAACLAHWLRQASSKNSCPNCRQPWCCDVATHASSGRNVGNARVRNGYLNVGALQGMSPERDYGGYGYRHW